MSLSDHPAAHASTPDPPSPRSPDRTDPSSRGTMDPWVRVAAWSAGVVVFIDVVFLALIQVIAHPLTVFAAITLAGVALLRWRPRLGMWLLVIVSLVALTDVGSLLTHLAFPTSGIDFVHAFVGLFGRLLVVAAGIAAWRRLGEAAARRTGTVAVGLLGAAVLLATGTSLLSSGQEPAERDTVTVIAEGAFEDALVASGGTLYVDNQDLFRHTYTVVGTDIDVHLDARQGERIDIDLDPGVYEVICVIPHHDFMDATLTVQ